MATSPYPSARYYLGLNVHDFNLTPAEFSSPHSQQDFVAKLIADVALVGFDLL